VSLWHILLGAVGALVGLEAAISVVLLIISASMRRRRRPTTGFPYLHLSEVLAGPNQIKIFSYGRDVYDAMLSAIDVAEERIYIESFMW
jgi:cardiolipin synthase